MSTLHNTIHNAINSHENNFSGQNIIINDIQLKIKVEIQNSLKPFLIGIGPLINIVLKYYLLAPIKGECIELYNELSEPISTIINKHKNILSKHKTPALSLIS